MNLSCTAVSSLFCSIKLPENWIILEWLLFILNWNTLWVLPQPSSFPNILCTDHRKNYLLIKAKQNQETWVPAGRFFRKCQWNQHWSGILYTWRVGIFNRFLLHLFSIYSSPCTSFLLSVPSQMSLSNLSGSTLLTHGSPATWVFSYFTYNLPHSIR